MSTNIHYDESQTTSRLTTLDLIVSCVPNVTNMYLAGLTLHSGHDSLMNRPKTSITKAKAVVVLAAGCVAIGSRINAVHSRRLSEVSLFERRSDEKRVQQAAAHLVTAAIGLALQSARLRRGATLIHGWELTPGGRVQGRVLMAYQVFTFATAGVELYQTRREWWPSVLSIVGGSSLPKAITEDAENPVDDDLAPGSF